MPTLASKNMSRESIQNALRQIFLGITELHRAFPSRDFTIDGRLVGDIGEILAEIEYDLQLDEVSQPDHDATTSDGRRVQVKATFKDALTFKTTPDLYLGLKLYEDGTFEEIFNGPGKLIYDHFEERKGIGVNLLSFPIAKLRELSTDTQNEDRIRKRKG